MPKKKTEEEVIKAFNDNGYTLLEPYVNSNHRLKCVDKDGYMFQIAYAGLRDPRIKGHRIVSNFNPYSTENIQLFLKKHHSKSVLLSRYVNEKDFLTLRCECGNIYQATWNHISLLNNLKCQQCAETIRHQNKMIKSRVENELSKRGLKLLRYNNAHNIHVQDSDGYKYVTSWYNIANDTYVGNRVRKSNPYSVANIKHYLHTNHIPLVVRTPNSVRGVQFSNYKFQCECVECGNVYGATWEQIRYRKRYRCYYCNKKESTYEYEVRKYLESQHINFVVQKTFIGCRKKARLPFDFYLCDYNCVIEVQGRQHYYENKVFRRTLKEQQEYDKFKRDYCELNDIMFIELPYYTIKDSTYKNIIHNVLG